MANVEIDEVMRSLEIVRSRLSYEVYLEIRCEFLDMVLRALIVQLGSKDQELFQKLAESIHPDSVYLKDGLGTWDSEALDPKVLEAREKILPLFAAFFRLKLIDDVS